ncbi:MAG: hypothetical protein CVU84_01990 [Firmicutes bacterium HGW-Firmicutes-1]|nr:MAG: hypothetical protein CVU84_01990 [Firmicutes bacterium HGW-Firmicutes-1]
MSNKTIAAIRAYEKVGFKKVRKDEKEITINNYLLHEYLGDPSYNIMFTTFISMKLDKLASY